MTEKLNIVAFVLAGFAGVLLLVSSTSGYAGISTMVLEELPLFIHDELILSVLTAAAFVLLVFSTFGGFTVILGGYLIWRGYIRTGKVLIGLGAGVGIPWLIYVLFVLNTTGELSLVQSQHNIIGWVGIILSLLARIIAK